MKKILSILVATTVGLFAFSSCTDWLDVAPKTDVPADELFETENGYLSALAGLYIAMTEEDVYGKNLSFGVVEQLAQFYDLLPDGTTDRSAVYLYTQTTSGAYNTKSTLENIWLAQYNVIANTNNLLKWLDTNGDIVITTENMYDMLRGEALALRAFLHFDILRGWGPVNYAGNPAVRDMKCMPYRLVADASKQPLLEARVVVEKIINDLLEARECLSYERDLDLLDYNGVQRRFRLNYHAVNAMLARVYSYAGEKEKAKECALEVIDACGLALESGNDDDPVLSREVIFGINIYEMEDRMEDYFAGGDKINTKNYITYATLEAIFETPAAEAGDMRAKSTAFLRNNDLRMAITRKYIDNDNEILPLIRLPEMYYIACDASEGADAADYVNRVRNKRGLSSAENVSCNSDAERVAALDSEYRKEFYAEGQYFWFLKSHGVTGALMHCPEVVLVEENFIFPLPDREKEYGWTEENDAEASDDNLLN